MLGGAVSGGAGGVMRPLRGAMALLHMLLFAALAARGDDVYGGVGVRALERRGASTNTSATAANGTVFVLRMSLTSSSTTLTTAAAKGTDKDIRSYVAATTTLASLTGNSFDTHGTCSTHTHTRTSLACVRCPRRMVIPFGTPH